MKATNAPGPLIVVVAATLAVLIPAAGRGQVIQQSGHALDANLRLGSGGYNSAVGGGRSHYERQGYAARRPSMDYYNSFQRQRLYTPDRVTYQGAASFESYRTWDQQSRFDGNPAVPRAPSWDRGYVPAPVGPRVVSSPPTLPTPPTLPGASPPAPGASPADRAAAQEDVLSYSIGYALGREIAAALERDGLELDDDPIVDGFRDGAGGREPRLSRDAINEILAAVREQVDARSVQQMTGQDTAFRTMLEKNLAESSAFREAFARREGVVTLPSGVQYEVLASGPADGPSPGPKDRVRVHYRLLGIDGQQLTEATVEVTVKDTVPGAAQILQMMRVGDRWLVAIPPELAYASRGRPPEIEPNESVLGEVELREILAAP